MNYFEHHLGDYAAATAHLSWDEDMAYTRLLRAYYHHERAIPEGQQYRLSRAATPAQKRAVDAVLGEFFELVGGEFKQKRAEAEIARFQDKQRKAKASADARWSHSGRNANASPDAMRTHSEGNAPSLQTPDTIPKNTDGGPPTGVARASESEDEGQEPTQPSPYGQIAKAMRQAGLADAHPGDLKFRTLVDQGATVEEFVAAADAAVAQRKPFAWALAAVIGKRRDAAAVQLAPAVAAPVLAVKVYVPEAPPTEEERAASVRSREEALAKLRGLGMRLKAVG